MSNSQDELIRAYKVLSALQKRIEQMTRNNIQQIYINEYHQALDKLSGSEIDTSEFHIPESEITPIRTDIPVSIGGIPSSPIYSREKYVQREYFLMKIDSVLGYLEIISSPEPKKIGFRKPEN